MNSYDGPLDRGRTFVYNPADPATCRHIKITGVDADAGIVLATDWERKSNDYTGRKVSYSVDDFRLFAVAVDDPTAVPGSLTLTEHTADTAARYIVADWLDDDEEWCSREDLPMLDAASFATVLENVRHLRQQIVNDARHHPEEGQQIFERVTMQP